MFTHSKGNPDEKDEVLPPTTCTVHGETKPSSLHARHSSVDAKLGASQPGIPSEDSARPHQTNFKAIRHKLQNIFKTLLYQLLH